MRRDAFPEKNCSAPECDRIADALIVWFCDRHLRRFAVGEHEIGLSFEECLHEIVASLSLIFSFTYNMRHTFAVVTTAGNSSRIMSSIALSARK